MIDIGGYINHSHNHAWAFERDVFIKSCATCMNADKNDAVLETYLRFQVTHKLYMERDNFDLIYDKFPGIAFCLSHQEYIIDQNMESEVDIIGLFLGRRATFGVGFSWGDFDYTAPHFAVPILKGGKMWQLMMKKVLQTRDKSPVGEEEWKAFSPEPLHCLFCLDYPRDLYPGNFIVNQNILFLRSFIWVDKRKLHWNRFHGGLLMYNESSKIIRMSFLDKYCNRDMSLNFLGNMAFFPPGKIFTSFIEIMVTRLLRLRNLNEIIEKLKPFNHKRKSSEEEEGGTGGSGADFESVGISIDDLVKMYRVCKTPKKCEIMERSHGSFIIGKRTPFNKADAHADDEYTDPPCDMADGERLLLGIVRDGEGLGDRGVAHTIVKWLGFPVTPINERNEILRISQALRRGEIDKAISQTSNLSKDFVEVGGEEIHSVMGAMNNLDVHRIGRFNRNAPSNSYANICNIACSLQKVLTKDSKTKEPRYITDSERGFIDLTLTPDTQKNSGLILEAVLDTVVSTRSLTAMGNMLPTLQKLFPNCERVADPEKLDTLDENFVYILANQDLYKVPHQIPANLLVDGFRLGYVVDKFGVRNLFRMTQYALKLVIPFIELIQHAENLLWECNSYDRNIYKLHRDGLFYSPREFLSFYQDEVESDIWVGKNGERIPNIFGPSIRLTAHPNKCHLPRVGHASFSAKNFVGTVKNSLSVGELHQKTVTAAFYSAKSYPSEIINLPGLYPSILIASGFNNQEDGICIRQGALDQGLFSATHYETASVKVLGSIQFTPTIKKGDLLRYGTQVAVFVPDINYAKSNLIYTDSLSAISYSNELKVIKTTVEGSVRCRDREIGLDHNDNYLSVIWVGKGNMTAMDNPCNDIFHYTKNAKERRSMAFQERNLSYQDYRCEKLRFNEIENATVLSLSFTCLFCPSIGDKLQTATANKGVITEIRADVDMPYVINRVGTRSKCIVPDLIINPQYLKRQTLDTTFTTGEKLCGGVNSFMNNCFQFNMSDSIQYLVMGKLFASGVLINPHTGYPYLTPVLPSQTQDGRPFFDYPLVDSLNVEDGFSYLEKNKDFKPHRLTEATIYKTRYFLVHNHKAANMMQASHPNDIITNEYTGTPIKGRKGGFSTGPQEQTALVGLGAERLNFEISQYRSEFGLMAVNNNSTNDPVVVPASKTMRRTLDELQQYEIDLSLKVRRCTYMMKKK